MCSLWMPAKPIDCFHFWCHSKVRTAEACFGSSQGWPVLPSLLGEWERAGAWVISHITGHLISLLFCFFTRLFYNLLVGTINHARHSVICLKLNTVCIPRNLGGVELWWAPGAPRLKSWINVRRRFNCYMCIDPCHTIHAVAGSVCNCPRTMPQRLDESADSLANMQLGK